MLTTVNKALLMACWRVATIKSVNCKVYANLRYLYMYLGALAMQKSWHKIIHRTDRCDISLFQLGKRWFRYVLRQGMPLPEFCLILPVRQALAME